MKTPGNTKSIILLLLRLICKYYIAYYMFSYAFAKILNTQFSFGPVWEADSNISNFDGFMLTWYYYGYSRTYVLIIAGCQILAGLLILFRKTERIGIVLLLSFMVNIVLVNIFYDIAFDAMIMSITLTLMGLFLLISDWSGFSKYFLRNKMKNETSFDVFQNEYRKYFWIPFILIPVLLYIRYDYINDIAKQDDKENKLVAVWKAIQNKPNQQFFKLYFDNRNSIKVKDFDRKIYYGNYKLNDSLSFFSFDIEHYTEIGAFRVQDSLNKLNLPKDSIKSFRKKIIAYYNKEMNAIKFKQKFNYSIEKDTLTLIDSIGEKQFFVNITKEYPSLND
ncbi:hypothetical protein SHK09_04455 [Polaribacter sp. PL03]|uniref:hypothetical protein n=1 Tax=Polaribacter sp. PL03 TaxID=3088353 RepID=UPI0029CCC39C|nr:hypothetical protein [Polaribacter sp. PL03]MDX6746033.1 hypothetical protein [Polaribacter sp. PL03]